MKSKFTCLILLVVLCAAVVSPVSAQTYLFQVVTDEVHLYLNADGTASIEYFITFANDPSASPLDYVDIGLPTNFVDMNSITADIDGYNITDIAKSPYVDPGIALGLGSNAIPAGQTGIVHCRIGVVKNLFYEGTEDEAEKYASFNFSPVWFGSEYVTGNTDLTMVFHFPPGLTEEEPRYFPPKGNWPGTTEPEAGFDDEDRVFYRWNSTEAKASKQYTFGGSFPARLLPEGILTTEPPPKSINFNFEDLCCWGFGLLVVGVTGFGIYRGAVLEKKRKLKYLPPKISIEGNGIKRGLTAIEAAILMEQPIDRIVTMILFSVIKKNAATVVMREPLKIDAADPLPADLHAYEVDFLNAFKSDEKGERTKALQNAIIELVKSVSTKMKGFSRKETIEYYRQIIEKAWEQVEAADTPDVKMERFDEYMGWTMLDRDFEGRTQRSFGSGPVFVPTWWGRYDPTVRPMTTGSGKLASPSPSGKSFSLPNLPGGSFAASMVTGAQSLATGVIGDLSSFTSKVTGVTNPPPKAATFTGTRSGGGGGGGHCVCACACACAGCACACAGGGR